MEQVREFEQIHITDHIGNGKMNATTRRELCTVLGVSDRICREMIEKARLDGEFICNDQDGKGYYMAESDEEILRQYRRDYARAMSLLKRLTPLRRKLKAAGINPLKK